MNETPLTMDDQNLIARTAVLAAATVAISKYSGRGGQSREFETLLNEYTNAARQNPDNRLLQTLALPIVQTEVAQLKRQFRDDPKQSVYHEFKMVALNRCAQVALLLDNRATPEDAALYKQTVVATCNRVAQANSERGILGIGATPVDVKETAVIDQVQRALRAV